MRRWRHELRFIAGRTSIDSPRSFFTPHLFILYSSPTLQSPLTRAFTLLSYTHKPLSDVSQTSVYSWKPHAFQSPFLPVSLVQVRHSLVKYRKRQATKRAIRSGRKPLTPKISHRKKKHYGKRKHYRRKHKPLSSYKGRFCLLKDGTLLRHRANRGHRRSLMKKRNLLKLKRPVIVCPKWANKIKKDGFKGTWF